MYLLLWIFVGFVVGWLAGKSLEGKRYGPSIDIAKGIGGAVVGGLLARPAGLSGYGETILTTFAAMACAAIFTTLTGMVNSRRIYSRQLLEPPMRESSRY